MIPRECKRLAEVDFPIAEVSRQAAREKSIRHGHPSTMHLWWARRPLASSRAVLLALLLPDPCDKYCPPGFKDKAKPLLHGVGCGRGETDAALRDSLLKFIADFSNWYVVAKRPYVETARALVRAAHEDGPPLLVDPFAGGGSIPLEALRLGCDAFASDLNPVACLILKAVLEDIPRNGPELANELRGAALEIKRQAALDLADVYPPEAGGGSSVAYLWARTVRCESPNCGAEIPLMRSLWLCKKANRKRAIRYSVTRGRARPPDVVFDVFEPKNDSEVCGGTITRAKATCLCCGAVLPPERVRVQLAAEQGGADVRFDGAGNRIGGARMTAVVTLRPNAPGRHYRLPTDADYAAVRKAQMRVADLVGEWRNSGKLGLCPIPDEPLPPIGTLGFRVQRYGMLNWGDLFTARQKLALARLGLLMQSVSRTSREVGSMALSRLADKNASLAIWNQIGEKIEHVFGRQALPIVWDFAEVPIFSNSTGNYLSGAELVAKVIDTSPNSSTGQIQLADATDHPLPDETASVWFTDPPYYDAVPYADLSDFFFVWLKRSLPNHALLQDPFDLDNRLAPKEREAVQDETKTNGGRVKDRAWFEGTMARAFAEGRRVLAEDGIGAVVFAHKTTEGWEALLSAMIQGGWTITGSWPIATERPGRLRSKDSAALATSVHLICRRRRSGADVGDWADVLHELPLRVGEWMARLQEEGVRGADLVFACIGPALEIYSRFGTVETAEGERVGLREYLEKVWEVVGRAALRQVLDADDTDDLNATLEEDARLTALFLWTMQSTEARSGAPGSGESEGGRRSGFTLPYDVVRRFAQPMGIDLDAATGRVIDQKKGVVHLLSLAERAKVLFGSDGAPTPAEWSATGVDSEQMTLFDDFQAAQTPGTGGEPDTLTDLSPNRVTTLDQIHFGMVLQAGGNAGALRSLIDEERQRGPGFLRLANALSALYPGGSQEKRVLDAMLLAVPR